MTAHGPPTTANGFLLCGEVAEWSKALRSGRSLFGGVGSNPTLTTFSHMGRVAQSVERRSDKAKVLGSSPSMTRPQILPSRGTSIVRAAGYGLRVVCPCGSMEERLTTDQAVAGSSPATDAPLYDIIMLQ